MDIVLLALLQVCGTNDLCQFRMKECMKNFGPGTEVKISSELKSEAFTFCFEHKDSDFMQTQKDAQN